MRQGELLWYVLVWVISTAYFIMPPGFMRHGRRARSEAEEFVDRSWGPDPHIATRLVHRRVLHACLLVLFVAGAVPMIALYAVGVSTDAHWLRTLGGIGVGLSAFPLGLDVPVMARIYFSNLDYYRWDAAGRPDDWQVSPHSQPKTLDLLPALCAGILLAWFFIRLTLG